MTAMTTVLLAATAAAQAPTGPGGLRPDLRVESLTVTRADGPAGQVSTLAVGEPVQIRCRWRLGLEASGPAAVAVVPGFKWRVSAAITVNREALAEREAVVGPAQPAGELGPLAWRAAAAGSYRVRCALDEAGILAEPAARRANNVAELTLIAIEAVRGL